MIYSFASLLTTPAPFRPTLRSDVQIDAVDLRFKMNLLSTRSASIQSRKDHPTFRTWGICTRRAGKLCKALSRLYRSQILQVNTCWKALAEIYTMLSFAPLLESINENWGKKGLAKTTPKRKNRSLISKFSLKIAEFLLFSIFPELNFCKICQN